MSSIESYDGLCGVIAPFASSDLQLRCSHPLSHSGDHSWEKYRENFTLRSYCGHGEVSPEEGFLNSVFSTDELVEKRAKEKQESRDKDLEDLNTGVTTREQLRKENGAFAFPKVSILFDKSKPLK